jgi:hypothetical protein
VSLPVSDQILTFHVERPFDAQRSLAGDLLQILRPLCGKRVEGSLELSSVIADRAIATRFGCSESSCSLIHLTKQKINRS